MFKVMIFAFSRIKILLNFAEVLILNSSELASYLSSLFEENKR